MESNKLSIKWLKFCIYWRLPVGIILNAVTLISLISLLSPNNLYSTLFAILYALLTIIYPLAVFIYALPYKKIGYYLLYSHFIVESSINSIFMALSNMITYKSDNFIINLFITLSVYTFLWVIPNIIYLKKRKELFDKNLQTKPIKKIKKQPQLKKIRKNINHNTLLIILISALIAIFLFISINILVGYINSLKNQIESSQNSYINIKSSYNDIKTKYEALKEEYSAKEIEYQTKDKKIEFYDKHIVFVLNGYGNYYYTYDEMKQVTQGKAYSGRAYNKEAAIALGYQAFSE